MTVGYITVDCINPLRLAAFWSAVLRYTNKGGDENWAEIGPIDGTGVPMLFQRVPERKGVKNRVHVDLNASDYSTELRHGLTMGGDYADGYERLETTSVLLDPQGNEFCLSSW